MKESNTLVGNVANISLRRELWIDTRGKYMKESNTLVDNAANIFLGRKVWLDTKEEYMNTFKNQFGALEKNVG